MKSLLTLLAAAGMAGAAFAAAAPLTPHQQLAGDNNRELIEINTVTATGDPQPPPATSPASPVSNASQADIAEGVHQLPPVTVTAQVPLRKEAVYTLCEPRSGAAAVSLGDYIYLIGGINVAGTALDSIERLDPKTGRSEKFALLKIARNQLRAVAVDGKIYVLGGRSRALRGLNPLEQTVEVIDPATRTVAFAPPMPEGRSRFACATVDGLIYVIGGLRYHRNAYSTSNTTMVFDPKTGRWTAGINMPTPRQAYAVTVDDFILVAGGMDGVRALSEVEVYSTREKTWRRLPALSETVNPSAVAFLGHELYLFGDGTNSSRIMTYDLKQKVSHKYPLAFNYVQFAAAVTHDGKIYLLGGTNALVVDTVQVFAPVAEGKKIGG